MVPDSISAPQFRAEPTGDDATPPTYTADHSDEAMRRLRDPFDARSMPSGLPEAGRAPRG